MKKWIHQNTKNDNVRSDVNPTKIIHVVCTVNANGASSSILTDPGRIGQVQRGLSLVSTRFGISQLLDFSSRNVVSARPGRPSSSAAVFPSSYASISYKRVSSEQLRQLLSWLRSTKERPACEQRGWPYGATCRASIPTEIVDIENGYNGDTPTWRASRQE